MNDIITTDNRILAMSDSAIEKVRALETGLLTLPQVDITHHHILHGGVYSRSILMPAGTTLTGAIIKVPTILIIAGTVRVFLNGKASELSGYNVFAASANRKQAFHALTDVYMTMVFASSAKTVAEAEDEFTDEAHLLASRMPGAFNPTAITGE